MKTLVSSSVLALAVTACASAPQTGSGMASVPNALPSVALASASYQDPPTQNASLWAITPNALLSMRRAKQVGDLLTVVVEMNDQASLKSSLSRSRDTSRDLNVDAFLGLPEWASGILPGGAGLSPTIDYDRASKLNGSGAVDRAEKVTFTLAARVVGVEPNGNLIIQGYQQTLVSNETRHLAISGVIRAQDISRTNVVSYEKIADAKLTYISSGEATSPIERKAAPKILDWILPF
ncbi:MAG: flagellar basal body L-ring protein FlgH [Hyphomonadaceae bacterium]